MPGNIDKLKHLIGLVGKDPYEGMDANERKLEKFKNILATLDEQVTKKEFEQGLKQALEAVLSIKKRLETDITFAVQSFNTALERMDNQHTKSYSELENRVDRLFVEGKLSEMNDANRNELNLIREEMRITKDEFISSIGKKLATIRNGNDGKNGRDGKDADPQVLEDILDTLQEIRKDVENLKKRGNNLGGGFVGAHAYTPTIITAAETPSDSLVEYTFAQKPSIVVVNGSNYREGHGWAWSNNKVVLDNSVGINGDIYAIL